MDSEVQEITKQNNNKTALETQVGGSHYKDMAIQPIEYCQKNHLSYCESNAIKYISRHRNKNGKEDILKAIHMLQLLLELDYPEKSLGDIVKEKGY